MPIPYQIIDHIKKNIEIPILPVPSLNIYVSGSCFIAELILISTISITFQPTIVTRPNLWKSLMVIYLEDSRTC